MAVFRGFPWKKVPIYVLSQTAGGCFGALLVYSNYMHAISIVDPHKTRLTASIFATYSLDYMPSGTNPLVFGFSWIEGSAIRLSAACFFSEFLGTAILLMVLLAALDKHNGPPPAGLVPFVLFILLLGEGAALGMETAFGLNPVCHIATFPCDRVLYAQAASI